jgi:hypothetical protein
MAQATRFGTALAGQSRQAPLGGRVLFIGGSGKSGSTLLGALLGQRPAFFNAGELNLFWEKWLEPPARCGCGLRLASCPFWSAVVTDVAAEGVDPGRMAALARGLDHTRRLLRVLGRRLDQRVAAEWAELGRGTVHLYESVYARCGAEFIVDGSKLTTHLMLLEEQTAIDLRLLHLVRDGRAVAYSWERGRRRVRGDRRRRLGHHRSVLADLAIWQIQNFGIDVLARRLTYATRLHYEELAADPGGALAAALARLSIAAPSIAAPGPEVAAPEIAAGVRHTIGGNDRVRFASPGTAVTVDEAWRRDISGHRRRLWTLLAWPGLRRWGYALDPERGRRRTPD